MNHSTEDGKKKKKTCAPNISPKMINETNFPKYEKHLHKIDVDKLRQMMELTTCMNISQKTEFNEIQEINVVIDKDFNEKTRRNYWIR